MDNEGQAGIGCRGYSKYDQSGASAEKFGGNTQEQDGIPTEASPESYYGGGQGTLKKAKENDVKGSSGKNPKKSRAENLKEHKRKVALENLKKSHGGRKPDWIKLEKYKTARLYGMNRYQAAIEAGYSHTYARHGSQKLDRLSNVSIQQALEDAGATNQMVAREIVNLAFHATKRQKCTVEVRQEDGEIIVDDCAAEVVPDLHLRKETLELIAKLKKQLNTNVLPLTGDYKRLVIMVEKDSDSHAEDPGRENIIDLPTKLRVEVAHK